MMQGDDIEGRRENEEKVGNILEAEVVEVVEGGVEVEGGITGSSIQGRWKV